MRNTPSPTNLDLRLVVELPGVEGAKCSRGAQARRRSRPPVPGSTEADQHWSGKRALVRQPLPWPGARSNTRRTSLRECRHQLDLGDARDLDHEHLSPPPVRSAMTRRQLMLQIEGLSSDGFDTCCRL